MSRKKSKPPAKSEKVKAVQTADNTKPSESGENTIRDTPTTRALHFLLGKEKFYAVEPEARPADSTTLPASSAIAEPNADLSISDQIDPDRKIADQSSSNRASSQGDSSGSRLQNDLEIISQLSDSRLNSSQPDLSQLLTSHQPAIDDPDSKVALNVETQPPAKPARNPVVRKSEAVNINWRAVDHTRIPQIVFDEILPQLPAMAQMPYLHLLRLTLGFQRSSCHISLESWAARCNQSLASIKRQAVILQQKGLLRKDSVVFGGAARGSYYRPVIPGILNDDNPSPPRITKDNRSDLSNSRLTQSRLSDSQLKSSRLKETNMKRDHEDHGNEIDHHENRVMMLYQDLTGNQLTRADLIAYDRLIHLDEDLILAHMRQIYERSVDPIGSFAYFTKAVLKATAEQHQTRAAQKRSLERIIERIRTNRVGGRATIADLIEEIKRACARDNVIYNNDLVNEILGL